MSRPQQTAHAAEEATLRIGIPYSLLKAPLEKAPSKKRLRPEQKYLKSPPPSKKRPPRFFLLVKNLTKKSKNRKQIYVIRLYKHSMELIYKRIYNYRITSKEPPGAF